MNVFRNFIMLLVNGTFVIFLGYGNELIMQYLNIQLLISKTMIVFGFILILGPMIFKLDVYETHYYWEERFLLFFKKRHARHELIRCISFLGLIPLSTLTIRSHHSYDSPSLKQISEEVIGGLTPFIPIVNGWISLFKNLFRLINSK